MSFEQKVNFFLKKYFFQDKFHKKGVIVRKNIFKNYDLDFFMNEVVKSNDKDLKKSFEKTLKEWENENTIPFIDIKTIEIKFNYIQYVKLNIEESITIKDFMYMKSLLMKLRGSNNFGYNCKYSFNENEIIFEITDLISLLFINLNEKNTYIKEEESMISEI